jgi:hypothetical protein
MGEKRSNIGIAEKDDPGRKRVKMRDLESVCRSEGEVLLDSSLFYFILFIYFLCGD